MKTGLWSRGIGAILLGVVLAVAAAGPGFAQGVRLTVNGEPITDVQVNQRVRLFTVEGSNAGVNGAIRQLTDELLMMQEARRLGITVSSSDVDAAYQQIARNVRVSKETLDQVLTQAGSSPDSLRARIAATIAWNAVVQAAVTPQVQVSDLELDQQAAAIASPTMGYDYILKEIIFIAPGGQNAAGRTAQADRYRQSFTGCDGAVQLSLAYTDAAVVDIGRRHATQLPEAIATELAALNVGGITRPRVTERGVSMLAVCEKAVANDLTFIKEGLRQEAGRSALEAQAERYLAELRSNARIINN